MTRTVFALAAGMAASITTLPAQSPRGASPGGGPPQAGDLSGGYQLEFSHSADGGLRRGGALMGDMDASWLRAGWSAGFAASPDYQWSVGLQWDHVRFDVPGGAPMPEDIYGLALRLGSNWRLGERWNLRSEARPGLYTDFEDISGGDFNVPFTVALGYTVNPDLQVLVAVNVDARREFPVVGGPGVIWRFAEGWRLSLVIPRPQIEFAVTPSLTLFAGGELRATAVRVSEDFGTARAEPVLDDDQLTYRELRVGGGARWQFSRRFRLTVEGGQVLDRRLEFDRGDVLLNGDGAPYFTVALAGSY